jgi:hypothetical protein
MRSAEVMREFVERCEALAALATVPELKTRLERLAARYKEDLQRVESGSIVPGPEVATGVLSENHIRTY